MHAKLVVVEPPSQIREYEVALPLTIGRGREAGLQLPHALVSRLHCELFEDHGRLVVRDLGSLNGTFVAGRRVDSAPIGSGELLTIGSVTLRAVYGDDVALAQSSNGTKELAGGVETVAIEDTAQATYKSHEQANGEPMEIDESRSDFFRPSDN